MKNRIATGEAIRSLWIESQSTPTRITRKSDAGVTLSHHVGCGHSSTPPVSGPTQPNLRRSLHKHHRPTASGADYRREARRSGVPRPL